MPTALGTLYCDADDVYALLSQEGADLRLDDDQTGTTSAAELLRLTTYAVNYATSRVNDYCLGRYEADDLDNNWTVNYWTTVIAARYLCFRRVNPIPKSITTIFDEVMEDLKALRAGEYTLGDVAERLVSSPAWSNIRFDDRFARRRARKESGMSEKTPPRVTPARDWTGDIIAPLETF